MYILIVLMKNLYLNIMNIYKILVKSINTTYNIVAFKKDS